MKMMDLQTSEGTSAQVQCMYYLLSCNPYCTGHVEWQLNTLPVFVFLQIPRKQHPGPRSKICRNQTCLSLTSQCQEVKDPISTTPKEKSTLRKRSPGLSKLTSATSSHCWVSTLGLTDGHRQIIEKGKWLEGHHISAAGKVLRQQFKDKINGLQDPGKAENPSLFIPQSSDPTIQIHHNGTNHWLTSTCKNLQKGSGAAVRQQMA